MWNADAPSSSASVSDTYYQEDGSLIKSQIFFYCFVLNIHYICIVIRFLFFQILYFSLYLCSVCYKQQGGRDSSLTGRNLEEDQAHMGVPPADGQLDKDRGERAKEQTYTCHTCKYNNYTERSKLELRGSEIRRSVHSRVVSDTCRCIHFWRNDNLTCDVQVSHRIIKVLPSWMIWQ